MKKILLSTVLLLFFENTCFAVEGELEKAKCFKISDGDTITVQTSTRDNLKIRVYGIDTPERNQALGAEATKLTEDLVYNTDIEIEVIDIDRYNRSVAIVYLSDGSTLQEHLISSGLAMVYPKYCSIEEFCIKLYELEEIAKEKKLGVWAFDEIISPWDFRNKK